MSGLQPYGDPALTSEGPIHTMRLDGDSDGTTNLEDPQRDGGIPAVVEDDGTGEKRTNKDGDQQA